MCQTPGFNLASYCTGSKDATIWGGRVGKEGNKASEERTLALGLVHTAR